MDKRQAWLIGLSVVVVCFGPGAFHLTRLSWKQHVLARQQRELEAARRQLATERERLASDPIYVEGLIRSTFKVAKPGEYVVPLTPDEQRNQ